MDLPQLAGPTTKEFKVNGHNLTFRKARLKDFETLSILRSRGLAPAEISVHMIAQLMYGYKQKFKARLKWMQSLEMGLDEANNIEDILVKLGLYKEITEEDLKKALENMDDPKKKLKSKKKKVEN